MVPANGNRPVLIRVTLDLRGLERPVFPGVIRELSAGPRLVFTGYVLELQKAKVSDTCLFYVLSVLASHGQLWAGPVDSGASTYPSHQGRVCSA